MLSARRLRELAPKYCLYKVPRPGQPKIEGKLQNQWPKPRPKRTTCGRAPSGAHLAAGTGGTGWEVQEIMAMIGLVGKPDVLVGSSPADPKAQTLPLAPASQYPRPPGASAIPTTAWSGLGLAAEP